MSDKQQSFDFDKATVDALKHFTGEALSIDSSRGFALTSIKAQYVVERLNQVFGLTGWSHTGEYRQTGPEDKPTGVVFLGKLTVQNGVTGAIREAVGFSELKRNIGDAYKGAKTDSLSKCASQLGIGNDVYKGKVAVPGKTKAPAARKTTSTTKDF